MHIERYEHGGRLLAVRIGNAPSEEGFRMATTPEDGLQVGRNRRPAGYVAKAHVHGPRDPRAPTPRQEVLHVLTGRIRVDLYSEDGEAGPRLELGPGETMFLRAGHAVEFLEESELLEIKEGPYPGPERDKRWLR